MPSRKLIVFAVALFWCASGYAQQPPPQTQTLTFYYGYAVKPGKEDDLMNLVKAVGAPVRDKLMADGVVTAWGVDTGLLRSPGGITHLIWFDVNDWAGVEKVTAAMAAQIAKLDAEAAAKGPKAGMTVTQRGLDVYDASKTRDWLVRNLVSGFSTAPATAGMLPYTRYNFAKVKPGKGNDYRAAWEKYNKPVLDKLIGDGTLIAYGLSVEEVKTDGEWTHMTWFVVKDMGGFDKVRDAFLADRNRRAQEERDAIADAFTSATEPDNARAVVTRATIFKVRMP